MGTAVLKLGPEGGELQFQLKLGPEGAREDWEGRLGPKGDGEGGCGHDEMCTS